jgi:hypothetical protein
VTFSVEKASLNIARIYLLLELLLFLYLMRSFLLMFKININSALRYSKLLTLTFLLGILEIFLCLLLVLDVKIVPPLDVHQTPIRCTEMLTYLVNIWLYFKVTFNVRSIFSLVCLCVV